MILGADFAFTFSPYKSRARSPQLQKNASSFYWNGKKRAIQYDRHSGSIPIRQDSIGHLDIPLFFSERTRLCFVLLKSI
jgi:hypothetical protein